MKDYMFVKDEIKFFMDKSFQFSFVYIGALFAIIAGSKLDVIKGIAAILETTPNNILIVTLLVLNLSYLTLASSCLFAVLKRGYFILINAKHLKGDPLLEWEHFVRVPGPKAKLRFLDWNVDNYFMVTLYALVWVVSIGLLVYEVDASKGTTFWYVTLFVGLLHFVPLWNSMQTIRLNAKCRDTILNGYE